jgi:hypothetical protein
VVFYVYITHNNARLIKATSRELAYIILGGVTLQYVLLFIVVAKPSTFVCYITYMGFNVSFTVVYAALLTRTNRIYRIFHAGKRTKKIPLFTSPMSQVIIVLMLIGIQVSLLLQGSYLDRVHTQTLDKYVNTKYLRKTHLEFLYYPWKKPTSCPWKTTENIFFQSHMNPVL